MGETLRVRRGFRSSVRESWMSRKKNNDPLEG